MKLVRHNAEPRPPTGRGSAVSAGQRPRNATLSAALQAEHARQAAIEKSMAQYVRLTCGHLTTKEEIERYSVFSTDPGKRGFCEKCGSFKAFVKSYQPAPLPDEPLF